MSENSNVKIDLTTWERVHLGMSVGGQQGTAGRIKDLLAVLEILELDDAEKLMTGWTTAGAMAVNWSQNLDWKLEFSKEEFEVLCGVAIPFDRWPVSKNVDPMITKLTQAMTLEKAK